MNLQAEIAAGKAFIRAMGDVQRARLIGSASFMPDAAADVDFLVLLTPGQDRIATLNEIEQHLTRQGFERCGEYPTEQYWFSVRRGSLNLIVTENAQWFKDFGTAMEVCKYLNLTDKSDRVAVCRIVRDAKTADQARAHSVADADRARADRELDEVLGRTK